MITSFCLVKTKKSEGKDKTGLFAWIRMQLTTHLCLCWTTTGFILQSNQILFTYVIGKIHKNN